MKKKNNSTSKPRKTFEAVKKDIGESNIRELTSINDEIYEDENMVALKCGPTDYHFMIRVDGVWYNKPRTTDLITNVHPSEVSAPVWITHAYVNGKPYNDGRPPTIYNDETIYFAIKKDWD